MKSQTDDFPSTDLTRRAVIHRAGVAILMSAGSPLLAACGASTSPERSATDAKGEIGGDVDFLSWEAYDLPAETKAWRKANDVRFRSTYIGTHNDIQAKLRSSGAAAYDVVSYAQGFSELYRKLEIATPLDEAKLPNLDGVDPFFNDSETAKRFWVVDGTRYGVPFTWGTTTCDYNPSETDEPKSWLDLLEPEFKGKLGWVPEAVAAFVLGGRILGFDVPYYRQEEFQEVADLLRRFRGQIRGFATSYGDLTNQFVSGEIVAAFSGWAAVGLFAKAKDVTIKSTVPSEGSFSFCDSFAIPSTADNRETVLAWINESLAPSVQAATAETLSAGVVVPAAIPMLSKAVRSVYPGAYDDLAGHFEETPLYPFPPLEDQGDGIVTHPEWLKEFAKIQAGH